MNVAKYWALGSVTRTNGMLVQVWRGSNESADHALQLANLAALETAQRIETQRENALDMGQYVYQRRNVPEELIATYPAMDGSVLAAITRNRYGALVLNTADVAIIDADVTLAYHKKPSLLNWFSKQKDPFEQRLNQIRQAAMQFPDTNFRIYRTNAGFRIIVASQRAIPNSQSSIDWLRAFDADINYRNLCMYQNSFRARLTPKPRNMKVPTPPVFFPYSHSTEQIYEAWLYQYEQSSQGFRVCQFIEQQGPDRFDKEADFLIRLHDQACRVQENLPLA